MGTCLTAHGKKLARVEVLAYAEAKARGWKNLWSGIGRKRVCPKHTGAEDCPVAGMIQSSHCWKGPRRCPMLQPVSESQLLSLEQPERETMKVLSSDDKNGKTSS